MRSQKQNHPIYGRLTWSDDDETWFGEVVVGTKKVRLAICVDEPSVIPDDYAVIYRALIERMSSLVRDASMWIVSDLADWLPDEEKQNPARIAQQMQIAEVEIYGGDGATVTFDGPTAIEESGHTIEARFDEGARLHSFALCG